MWFNKSTQEVLKELNSDALNGLSSTSAKERLATNGENKLAGKKKKSIVALFFAQINDVMIYILLAAALIS
ncbi:MAG: cation-transporting P-type ATPase, partial [Clostridium sp.]